MIGDYFQIALFVCLILGIILVIFSLFLFYKGPKREPNNYLERSNTIKAIEASIDEMDRTMKELTSTSKAIFEEMDQKYAELMFLYSSIEELKADDRKNIGRKSTERKRTPTKNTTAHNVDIVVGDGFDEFEPSQLDRILMLQREGVPISEIARRLDMGQGEVTLILELGKVR